MSRVMIKNLGSFIGKKVKVSGWLYSRTSKGKLIFLLIRDGTALVQAIVSRQMLSEEQFNLADKLTQESSLELIGVVREDKRAVGGYEIEVESLRVFQICENYPISPKKHGVEFLLSLQHLWIRSQHISSVLKIRAEIISAARNFLNSRGFYQVDTPILTPFACEGTSTLFEVEYFGEPAYLAQSGQLYNEATCMSLGKVYTFGPTFRAEKSRTRRHLMEFWMLEPEMAFVEQEENMVIQEELIYYIVSEVLRNCSNELAILKRDISFLKKVQTPFPRLTYSQAVEILREKGFDIKWGGDFGAPHETAISSLYEKPVFITHYPASIKAFYMQPDFNNPELALCADLIASEGYGEIIGGSQRIHDYDLLKKKITEHHLPIEAYQWYLDLRKYGSVPHSGFGLGLERTVCWIGGLSHIRETIAFPRMLDKIYP
ncbi:MAG: Asparagine--tRNA ligase [candidate division WS2 bacterium]|nr:Asparagine--tRNA ligase [Candidatus Lithacetigena glycinireducens]